MAQLVNTEKAIDTTMALGSGQALIAGPFPVRPHAYTRTVWLDVDASLRIARELGITEAVSCFDAAERLKRAYPAAHIVYGSVQLDDEFVIWTHAWCMLDGSIIDPRYVVMDVYNDIHRYLSAGYFHTPVTARLESVLRFTDRNDPNIDEKIATHPDLVAARELIYTVKG